MLIGVPTSLIHNRSAPCTARLGSRPPGFGRRRMCVIASGAKQSPARRRLPVGRASCPSFPNRQAGSLSHHSFLAMIIDRHPAFCAGLPGNRVDVGLTRDPVGCGDQREPHHSRFFTNEAVPSDRFLGHRIAHCSFSTDAVRFAHHILHGSQKSSSVASLRTPAELTEQPLAQKYPPAFPFTAWRGIGLALGRGFPPSLG